MKRLLLIMLCLMVVAANLHAQGFGKALIFDGSNDGVEATGGVATTAKANLTMEAWVKWSGSTGSDQIIMYNGDHTSNGYGLFLDASNNHYISIDVEGSVVNSSTALSTGVWTHVAAERSTNNWYIYVNGVESDVGKLVPQNAPTTSFTVGANPDFTDSFNGSIDDVRVSDARVYNGAFVVSPPYSPLTVGTNTELLYHFDEGTGQTTADASTNNNHGQRGSTGSVDGNDPIWTDDTLPVLMYSFSAHLLNNKVELKWQTSPLTEFEIFEVQRDINEKWETIATIEATPLDYVQQGFFYVDDIAGLSNGISQIRYRIQYIDMTGEAAFSPVQIIALKKPTSMWLAQNFPNPFNPGTTISYAITEPADVKLIVYNSLGEQVRILVNEYQYESIYSVPFDASRVPSGLYFYKLLVNNRFVDMKKMLVMK